MRKARKGKGERGGKGMGRKGKKREKDELERCSEIEVKMRVGSEISGGVWVGTLDGQINRWISFTTRKGIRKYCSNIAMHT